VEAEEALWIQRHDLSRIRTHKQMNTLACANQLNEPAVKAAVCDEPAEMAVTLQQ
jgi:hypothetical protein